MAILSQPETAQLRKFLQHRHMDLSLNLEHSFEEQASASPSVGEAEDREPLEKSGWLDKKIPH